MADPTDDQKRRMAGMCCYNMLGLTSTAAFICAIYSYAHCDFITRTVTLTEGNTIESVCADTGYTGSMDVMCQSLLSEHGIGFEGFWITVPVDTKICYAYTLVTPWGFQSPNFDTKFNSARALSITAIVLGGAAWFTLMMASCCKLDQSKLNGLGCYFTLATLFQGLSLLMFRSNVCSPGFFSAYFTPPGTAAPATPSWMAGVSCGLSRGSNCAIAATVLWFVCGNMLPASVVPAPLWKGSPQETPDVAFQQSQDEEAKEDA